MSLGQVFLPSGTGLNTGIAFVVCQRGSNSLGKACLGNYQPHANPFQFPFLTLTGLIELVHSKQVANLFHLEVLKQIIFSVHTFVITSSGWCIGFLNEQVVIPDF